MSKFLDLASLLAPKSTDSFLRDTWSRMAYVARAQAQDRFASLFDIAEFEFLAGTVAAPGWLSFVKDAAQAPARDQLTSDGTLDTASLYKAVSEGRSLLLTRVHRLHEATGALCRKITADFRDAGVVLRKPVRANAYFTPPNAQAFDAHYDHHDVLVLQLAGSKRWWIYGEAERWPRRPMPQTIPAKRLGEAQEVVLQVGDVLYLPRGFVHEARTVGETSLHLTLSVQAATWSDVFERLIDRSDHLGEPLPVGFCTQPSEKTRIASLASGLIRSPELDKAIYDIINATLIEGDLPSSGLLARLGPSIGITSETLFVAVNSLSAKVEEQSDGVILRLPGAALRADKAAKSLFERVCSQRPFRLAELGNVAALIDLTEDLVKRGVLVIVPR